MMSTVPPFPWPCATVPRVPASDQAQHHQCRFQSYQSLILASLAVLHVHETMAAEMALEPGPQGMIRDGPCLSHESVARITGADRPDDHEQGSQGPHLVARCRHCSPSRPGARLRNAHGGTTMVTRNYLCGTHGASPEGLLAINVLT